MRFLYTLGEPGVCAWDVPDQPDTRCIDVARYQILLQRAVETVLAPIEQSVHGGKDGECLYLFQSSSVRALALSGKAQGRLASRRNRHPRL
ncbi:MAG: hypothetical protein ABSA01_08165 [Anaerolineales bacterium]|jgi:hypothetical protein